MTACALDEQPDDELPAVESTVSQSIDSAPMSCSFPGTTSTVGDEGLPGVRAECKALEPGNVRTIRFEAQSNLNLGVVIRVWKIKLPLGEKEVRRSGCGRFDKFCEIAIAPACQVGPPTPSGRGNNRFYTATLESYRVPFFQFTLSSEIAVATAQVPPAVCSTPVAEVQPVCNLPAELPFLLAEDTGCNGLYLFKFAKTVGSTRYEAESVQNGFDWSFARREFNCATETISGDVGNFRITVGNLARRLRFRACNDCGCSPWDLSVEMHRNDNCQ